MSKTESKGISSLGVNFQVKLLASILADHKFADRIMEILDPNYFEDETLKIISAALKEAYDKDEVLLDMVSLEARLLDGTSSTNTYKKDYIVTYLDKIKAVDFVDMNFVQARSLQFCKGKEMKNTLKECIRIIDTGTIDDYPECEELVKKAMEKGSIKDTGENVGDNLDQALDKDFRKPIPTGIKGLDAAIDGGLSKGELGIILASTGVGKSTTLTKIANSAKNAGFNVLHIFFEDLVVQIRRKHYACWTKYKMNELHLYKDDVKRIINERLLEKGEIKLHRFPSGETTMTTIKHFIKKLISQGFIPDVVILDYITCVKPSRKVENSLVGEELVMRQFEAMAGELNFVAWTACQANRTSIDESVITNKQMGGSISKAQIGHLVVTIGRDPEQKSEDKATITVAKSRFGESGVIFENILFDTKRVQIEVDANNKGTYVTNTKTYQDDKAQKRTNFVLESAKKNRINVLHTELSAKLDEITGPAPTIEENNNEITQ